MIKHFHVSFNGESYSFTAEPIKQQLNEPIRFRVDLNGGNPSIIEYIYGSWQQYQGRQIYTDLMINVGLNIQRSFPEIF